MSLQRFANAPIPSSPSTAWASLSIAIDADDTTLVPSTNTPFPSLAQFDVLLEDEIIIVTTGGSSWTVTRGAYGTTAASHAAGTGIFHVLTSAALNRIPRSMMTLGDMEYLDANGAPARLAAPSDGTYTVAFASGVPSWTALNLSSYATLTGAETLTNKTLLTPVIASFTNAQHTHQNAAGGGLLDAAAIGSGTLALARMGTMTADQVPFVSGSALVGSADLKWTNAAGLNLFQNMFKVNQQGELFISPNNQLSGTGIYTNSYATTASAWLQYNAGVNFGLVQMAGGNNTYGVYNEFIKTRSTDGTTLAAAQIGDTAMVLNSYADSGADASFGYMGTISSVITGTPVPGQIVPSKFEFYVGKDDNTAPKALELTPTLATFSGGISVGTASTATGAVAFKGTTSGTVTLSTADAAGTWTMKLPTSGGTSGYFLQTDGSGNTTWAAGGGGLTIGSTTITSGTNNRILYNNSGVVGEYTLTGTGTVVAMQTSPAFAGQPTIAQGTITTALSPLTVTSTWNAGGVTFPGIVVNVTETARANGSALLDVQTGGASVFKVVSRSLGNLYQVLVLDGAASAPAYSFRNSPTTGFAGYGGYLSAIISGSVREIFGGGYFGIASDMYYAWSSTTTAEGSPDLTLYRGAADTLAQYRSTNAQTYQLFNTRTDASNGEWATLNWASNILHLGATKNGTGTARTFQIDYGGTTTAAISVPATSGAISLVAAGYSQSYSASAPAIFGSGSATSGLSFSNGGIYYSNAGSSKWSVNSTGFVLTNTYVMGWASGAADAGANDTGVARDTAGVVEINNGTAGTWRDLKLRKFYVDQTITAGGTTGNQTINKAAGIVNLAAAASSVTVTSSLCTTSSTIYTIVRTNDATALVKNVVPGSGSFVINMNAAVTAETSIGFMIIN